jgi:transitional endoplasmic reticulum ATPase
MDKNSPTPTSKSPNKETQAMAIQNSPEWFNELKESYTAGERSAFILHLNTADYAVPGITLVTFLVQVLAKNREIVAFYNRSGGITFPNKGMERLGKEVMGLEDKGSQGNSGRKDNMLAALGVASGDQGEGELPKAPAAALPLLEKLLVSENKSTAVIIEYADALLPASDMSFMSPDDRTSLVTLQRWGRDPKIMNSGNLLILICGNLADLHPALRSASSRFKAVELPLPDRDARKDFLTWYREAKPESLKIKSEVLDEQFASMTAGLSLVHIEDILLRAETTGSMTMSLIREAKTSIIEQEYAGLLDIIEPGGGFETVGGMELLKAWSRREIIDPVKTNRTNDVPKGVILVGPPGTGKTFFVSNLAKEIGFNAVSLSMENILGGIVGTSERNLSKALSVVRSLSPVLVFVDELDQSDISARGNNSGNPVAKNLFSQLLRFLGDEGNRGKVIFFGASNRPDFIDPALMRFGRTDAIIPVLLPDEIERTAVIKAQAKAQKIGICDEAVEIIVENSVDYSGADLAAICIKARKTASAARRTTINLDDAKAAVKSIRPVTLRDARYYTLLAIKTCTEADLLPERYAALLDDQQAVVDEIEELKPQRREKRIL